MSTLKADAVTSSQDNTALTLSGRGSGGVKVNDFFVQTKGSDISSATSLTLGKDGNQFDVTGTTTITSIATQGIGSYVTLHFDGALTFTHHSTNLILPGAANITTAAGDIAVMYEYASADWRCVSYTKASGAAVVSGGITLGTEQATTSGTEITFGSIPAGTKKITVMFEDVSQDGINVFLLRIGDAGGIETSGYVSTVFSISSSAQEDANSTIGFPTRSDVAAHVMSGTFELFLKDSANFTWVCNHSMVHSTDISGYGAGYKSLSAELTQVSLTSVGTPDDFDGGSANIQYE